jgi:hypothetical protein
MSMTADVITTLHNDDAHRCVKIIKRSDGTFAFNEFRRDPEDAGGWTLVRENAGGPYATQAQAVAAARDDIAWLRDQPNAKRHGQEDQR